MSGLAFDTLAYTRRMEQAGFSRAQAEALADEQAKLIDERLSTKADLARVEAGLKSDLARVEAGLKSDIAHLETTLRAEIARVEGAVEALRTSVNSDLRVMEAGLRAELWKWLLGVSGVQTIVISIAVFGLIRTMIR